MQLVRKNALSSKIQEVEIDGLSIDKQQLHALLIRQTDFQKHHTTFPIIFIGTKFIGGYSELLSSLPALS